MERPITILGAASALLSLRQSFIRPSKRLNSAAVGSAVGSPAGDQKKVSLPRVFSVQPISAAILPKNFQPVATAAAESKRPVHKCICQAATPCYAGQTID